MALSRTVGMLVTWCKQRADKESDPHIADDVKPLISELYGELHALTVEKGARYFETEATLNLASLALPSDHLTTIGVDYVIDAAGRRRQLKRLPAQWRHAMLGRTGEAFRYALEGANLALYPTPSTGTYKHLYVPQPTDLSAAADDTSVDLINIWGQKFLVWGVASVLLHKGEADQVRAVRERDAAQEQLEYWATQRALLDPNPRVVDDDEDDLFADPAEWRFWR